MHPTGLQNAKRFFETYAAGLDHAKVVDIGSLNINGSVKDVCPSHLEYVGVDFAAGPGVNFVLKDPYELPFDDASIDMVTSSSCFEHSEMFWLSFLEILRILKPEGLFYLNVPSNGRFHRHPVDCWRFYPDSGNALVAWAKRNHYDPLLLESYTGKQDLEGWNDFVAVFVKDGTHAHSYPKRITASTVDFYNGIVAGGGPILNQRVMPEDQRTFSFQLKNAFWLLRKAKAKAGL